MLQLVTDYPTVQVLHVAAQLRLADLLAAGPQRIEDLAAATGTHAPSLARLLRMLAARAHQPDTGWRAAARAYRDRCVIASSFWPGTGTGHLGQLAPPRAVGQAGVRSHLRHEQIRLRGTHAEAGTVYGERAVTILKRCRTKSDFRRLPAESGFELRRVSPTQLTFSILEGRPR